MITEDQLKNMQITPDQLKDRRGDPPCEMVQEDDPEESKPDPANDTVAAPTREEPTS